MGRRESQQQPDTPALYRRCVYPRARARVLRIYVRASIRHTDLSPAWFRTRCRAQTTRRNIMYTSAGRRRHLGSCFSSTADAELLTFAPLLKYTHAVCVHYAVDARQCTRRFHQRTVHEGRKDFACDECEKKFGHKQHLLRHQRTVHETQKNYALYEQCSILMKSFEVLIKSIQRNFIAHLMKFNDFSGIFEKIPVGDVLTFHGSSAVDFHHLYRKIGARARLISLVIE
ncbi:unnamed protein product [Trichogramma brassicae]|uniref:C2H2-type domain-containing protein n=1 Tax=Trichogramma brassicae TaxID=86971 RepID=A0A6H5I433_9HYME|nr:unnamed protein product [Trichogramma brassicae]